MLLRSVPRELGISPPGFHMCSIKEGGKGGEGGRREFSIECKWAGWRSEQELPPLLPPNPLSRGFTPSASALFHLFTDNAIVKKHLCVFHSCWLHGWLIDIIVGVGKRNENIDRWMIMTMKEVMLKRMTRGSTSDNIDKWMMVMVMLVKHSDNIDRSYQVPSFSAASQQAELERDQKRWREGRDHPEGSPTSACLNNLCCLRCRCCPRPTKHWRDRPHLVVWTIRVKSWLRISKHMKK